MPTPTMSSSSVRGTLILLREAGCRVTIATMTPGDCGSAEHDAEAIADIRRREAQESAALIGADYLCLEFRDLAIFNDDESRRRVTEVLAARPARPDPDGAARRLHRRPRDDQPAGARRLLRGIVPELRDAAVGARAAAGRGSRTCTSSIRWGDATARAGRCPSISSSMSRGSSRPSGGCWPATPASATGCSASTGSTSTWRARRGGARSRGAEIGVAPGGGIPPVSGASLSRGQPAARVIGQPVHGVA